MPQVNASEKRMSKIVVNFVTPSPFRALTRIVKSRLILRGALCLGTVVSCAFSGAVGQAQTALPPAPPSGADSAPTPGTFPNASPAFGVPASLTTAGYLLGPGDIISVTVEGYPQYTHDQVPVSPDGKITLTFYGAHKVNKLTVSQVQQLLLTQLRKRMRNPRLTVSLARPRPQEYYAVFVLGNGVRSPGVIQIHPNYRVTEAIAKVGGLAARPDDVSATLTRGKAAPIKVDLVSLLAKPSSPTNIKLAPNDVLTLTQQEAKRITIDGDVARPGIYLLRRFPAPGAPELPLEPKLRDAIIAAGSVKSPYPRPATPISTSSSAGEASAPPAAPRFTAYILRGSERIPLNIEALGDFTDRNANVALLPNDYVRVEVVPPTRVVMQGLVRQSGELLLTPGSNVIDAIAAAGGLTLPSDKVVVSVSRAGNIIPVDLNRALLRNDPTANPLLLSGDNVLVEEPATILVTLSGEFARPSLARLKPDTTLLDAIAGAGGLKVDPADARLSLVRNLPNGKQTVLFIDPVGLFRRNDLSQNVRLQDEDVINVASIRRATVYVMGEVNTVGVQTLGEKEGLAQVIARAGGPTPRAALTKIMVQRGSTTQMVDAYDSIKEGAPTKFELQEGDYIVVPPIKNRVMVMEAVANPSFYPIPEKGELTALAAISLAGGATSDAVTKQIAILRPTDKGVTTQLLSLKDIRQGKWAGNTVLQDGDVVYVPRRDLTPSLLNRVQQTMGTLLLGTRVFGGG